MKIIHLKSDNDHNNINMIKNHIVSKPCLVFIVAPWCGFCKKLQPTINTLENDLVKEPEFKRDSLITVHDDQLKHINQKVKSFPTIRMFVKGKSIPDYSDEFKREANDIRNYIRKHMKNKKKTKKNVKTKKKSKRLVKTFNISRKNKNKKGGGKVYYIKPPRNPLGIITNIEKSNRESKLPNNLPNILPDRAPKKLEIFGKSIRIYVAPYKDISDWADAEKYAINIINGIPLKYFGIFPIVDAIEEGTGRLLEIKKITIIHKYDILHQIASVYTSPQQWNELVTNKIGGDICVIFEGKYSLLNNLQSKFTLKGAKSVKTTINFVEPLSSESEDLVVFIVRIYQPESNHN